MRVRMVDYLIDRIYENGAKHIFFVPGTGCMFLTDALARKKELNSISMHHEQAAGMAALTYAKVNNCIGACVVTTGCGGTNAVTAVLHAWQDNVPCVFISGQAARHQTVRNSNLPLRQMGRQETDIISIVSPITKFAKMINDVGEIVSTIDKAIHEATTGRKGPVWIDVPMDIQNSVFDPDEYQQTSRMEDRADIEFNENDLNYVISELQKARRPVILAGNGIRLANAREVFLEFIKKYKIPVTYTRLGHDLMDNQDSLSIGMVGMLGASRAGNFAIQNSDLVISIGTRLSIDTTGYEYEKFARDAKIIVVDIDETEHLKNTVKIERLILANAKSFFEKMLETDIVLDLNEWAEKCLHWKGIFPTCLEEYRSGGRINMYYFTEELSKVLHEKSIVISDAGNSFFTVSPIIRIKEGQRSITSGAEAEMGYALPASIGAAFARENSQVVAVNGDGSVMMNLQEFETLAYHNLNIKIFIMNNNGYSSIRHLQKNAFRNRQIGCDSSNGISFPDFRRVSEAFHLKYKCIEGSEALSSKIEGVLNEEGTVVCEVMCVEEQQFLGVSSAFNSKHRLVNRPLEDQAPFLDRDIFLREMIVEPIDQ